MLTLYMSIVVKMFFGSLKKKENFLLVDKAPFFFDLNLIQDIHVHIRKTMVQSDLYQNHFDKLA